MAHLVKYVIEGVQFAMETVNFMMFICQEASQVSIMAFKEAMRQKKYKVAQDIIHGYMARLNLDVRDWAFMYGMALSPSWKAFYCYYYCTKVYILQLEGDFYREVKKEMVKEGLNPNAKIDGKKLYVTWIEKH
jgi:hypothetical protein